MGNEILKIAEWYFQSLVGAGVIHSFKITSVSVLDSGQATIIALVQSDDPQTIIEVVVE